MDGTSNHQPTGADQPAGTDFGHETEVEVEVERRRSPRIQVRLDAEYRRLGRDSAASESATVDVSHGGARITAPTQVAIGDVLQLTVAMPHGIELTLQGLVVQLSRSDDQHHAHLAFDSLSTAAADLLTDLLDLRSEPTEAEPLA